MNTETYCCENPVMPKGVTAGYGVFGGYRAVCANCDYVCGYWECACELEHECEGAN